MMVRRPPCLVATHQATRRDTGEENTFGTYYFQNGHGRTYDSWEGLGDWGGRGREGRLGQYDGAGGRCEEVRLRGGGGGWRRKRG